MNVRKALIVDDSRLAQFVLKKMLLGQDLSVDISPSAEDALNYLKDNKPDIIFLDHTMPGMNGLEVLKVIKAHPEISHIPVMMYTSQEDNGYVAQARELGAVEVLPKQLKPSELAEALLRLNLTTVASEEESPSQSTIQEEAHSFVQNKEELETLVYNAEIALSHESAQQRLQNKLEQQQNHFEQQIATLHTKIDAMIPNTEQNTERQHFWNNLLWGAIYCLTLLVFGSLYFQQKNQIQDLANEQSSQARMLAQNTTQNNTVLSRETNFTRTSLGDNETQTINTTPQASQAELNQLENLMNENNQIPYDELLLGDTVQANLTELINTLASMNFSGQVNVIAHDGSFCLKTSNGQFELAPDDLPSTQCQISDASERLVDIASIGLLQLVNASNLSNEINFEISLDPLSNSAPLESYPQITETILAGSWNDIASKNRRVEFRLIPE